MLRIWLAACAGFAYVMFLMYIVLSLDPVRT